VSIPKTLIDQLTEGRIVPFVGSGVSLSLKPSLFPTWTGLLEQMAGQLDAEGKPSYAQIVRLLCETGQVFRASEQALAQLGKAQFNLISRNLRNNTNGWFSNCSC